MDYSSWEDAINTAESLIGALEIEFCEFFLFPIGGWCRSGTTQLLADPELQRSIQKI
jgi:hypothetical protein